MRRAAKVDAGQGEIVFALLAIGATVQSLAAIGRGCPDLLVGYRGRNYLLEVKAPPGPDGGTSGHGRQLGPDQVKWHRAWSGQVATVRTTDEAFAAIGAIEPAPLP